MTDPTFFSSPGELRGWFEANHDRATELWVGFYRVASGKGGITWRQAVDEALCFGWIDGIRKGINPDCYTNRFTPRKAKSSWSKVNIANVERLKAEGRMQRSGLEAFERRVDAGYSYEHDEALLDKAFLRCFKEDAAAWAFFDSQAPSYKRTAIFWVMSAKSAETRVRRLEKLIRESAIGRRAI